MDLLNNLALGFHVAMTMQNLLYALAGALLGTLIGVLPGLGPVATIAMLLPSIYALDATPALIMLAGIYYGAQYGGSTTAILINVPGESSSVVTAIDGYQMARQGRAGAALAAAGLGSFFAGCVGTVIIAAFAPPLTELAFKFGPAEYFSLMVLGLIGAVVLASGSLVKAISMILLGLLLGQINTDVISGTPRFSFDIPELTDGIGFVVIAMGIFGFGEIIANLGMPAESREVFTKDVKGLWPTKQDFQEAWPSVLRGTALGSILGVLPGGGALLASFASYTLEKKIVKNPRIPFGKGAIQGVAGPESANNAGAQTSFIPMLTLGIPPNAVMALMVGAMTIKGIQPGPQVMTSNPELFWGFDCFDVDWQPDAGGVESAADRHLDQAADGALSILVPGHRDVLLHRHLHAEQQQLRCVHDGCFFLGGLPVLQTELRACTTVAGLHLGPHDGGEPAPGFVVVPWRLGHFHDATPFSRPVDCSRPDGRDGHAAFY